MSKIGKNETKPSKKIVTANMLLHYTGTALSLLNYPQPKCSPWDCWGMSGSTNVLADVLAQLIG